MVVELIPSWFVTYDHDGQTITMEVADQHIQAFINVLVSNDVPRFKAEKQPDPGTARTQEFSLP